MPIFQPRNRVQILREMIARVVARSSLTGVLRNSVVYHILASAANEDAEQYVQMARLRTLFSIDLATGSDLDERAKEIQPAVIKRRAAVKATGNVAFTRTATVGVINIPAGTLVAARDAEGEVRFRTTASASILNGNTTSGSVAVVAVQAGIRGNVAAGSVSIMVNRVAGVNAVTNSAKMSNGQDRESDENFRKRLKAFIQSISRGTKTALEGFSKNAIMNDGRRVLFSHVVETVLPSGYVRLYIDDGSGAIEEYDTTYEFAADVIVASATGGELDLYTTERPIRDDGSFVLEIDTGGGFVEQVRGQDYELNAPAGQIELYTGDVNNPIWLNGLPAGAVVRAFYRFYIGLIQHTQKIIDGDPNDAIRFPGVRAAGIQVSVLPPSVVFQSVTGNVSVLDGFDATTVTTEVKAAIQDYINTLDIGDHVIVSEIIERAMGVPGMYNIKLDAPTADQTVLKTQVARINDAAIVLT